MDLQLSGKKALVAGSTKGIGKAIAAALAREGARVVVNGRSEDSIEDALADMKSAGDVRGVAADLSDPDDTEKLVREAGRDGPIDILVNNVGIFGTKPFADIPDDEWMQCFDVNVMSGVRLSRAVLPGMIERGWGRILFISSESGVNIDENMLHYSVTKTAQLALSRGLAQLARGTDVTVNSVLPGPTWTEGVEEFVAGMASEEGVSVEEFTKDFFDEARPTSLIRRWAKPEEVAALCAFVASPLASDITGAPLRTDGGVVQSAF